MVTVNRTTSVSIPAWCDWENPYLEGRNMTIRFQFQLGAIGSKAASWFVKNSI